VADPNPGRGMPAELQKYWLVGKGAAKIRWHLPHDFDRCVRNLRKYFPKNPEGLCNILHQKAVGAPPGKGHGEHSLTASITESGADMQAIIAAQELLDRQPELGQYTWAGPLAPIGRPTGEPRRTRIFEPGALYHRTLPLPLDWRERNGGQGHEGAVTVGRILGITYGPDHAGLDWCWGWGDFLDEEIVPAARHARYLAAQGVAGPSLDPGGALSVAVSQETGFEHMTKYGIGGATLVSIPAFASLRPMVFGPDEDWPDNDPDMPGEYGMDEEDCGCGEPTAMVAAVNSGGWRGLPLAPREAVFDNDDAVKRITAWAQGGQDVNKMRRAFMWSDPSLPPTDPTSYRLPVGDVINGNLTLIFHAIYAAAALLSGAHGGLPQVPEPQIAELRNVISDIYPVMAKEFNDSSIRAPWDRSAQPGVQMSSDTYSAAGFPLNPPKSWFEDPKLTGKTRLTVTDEGRVYGHLAAWNECHRDMGNRECVMAPKSQQAYAPFHLGTVVTQEGDEVPVGKIVMDTRHASINLGYTAAAVHYDNTGDEVAVIRCGEDEYGIWFAGAVVPEATPYKVAKLRRSPLSGDWRREGGSLELTAALAVNAPAFPVYALEDDERTALVAGLVWEEDDGWRPPTGIGVMETVSTLVASLVDDADAEDRAQVLKDLLEDEEIYAQRERAEKLRSMYSFSVDPGAPAAPAAPVDPAAAAPVDPAAPVESAGESATDAAGMDWKAWNVAAENSARYVIVKPGIGNLNQQQQQQAPQAAAPAPPTQPVQE
jgi:hypothetical protein